MIWCREICAGLDTISQTSIPRSPRGRGCRAGEGRLRSWDPAL